MCTFCEDVSVLTAVCVGCSQIFEYAPWPAESKGPLLGGVSATSAAASGALGSPFWVGAGLPQRCESCGSFGYMYAPESFV
jgi:hypothetical protein